MAGCEPGAIVSLPGPGKGGCPVAGNDVMNPGGTLYSFVIRISVGSDCGTTATAYGSILSLRLAALAT